MLKEQHKDILIEIKAELEATSLGKHFSPTVWTELQRQEAQLSKAIELEEKNHTPFWNIFQRRKEYLEIQLAGAMRAQEVQQKIFQSYGIAYPNVMKSLKKEVVNLKQKLCIG